MVRLILLFAFFSLFQHLSAQDTLMSVDEIYGPDQLLFNGKKYIYFLPENVEGNQFIFTPDFISGDITLKGITFKDLLLNYDIYNQQLLLLQTNPSGGKIYLEISKAWLESFRLEKMKFEYLNLSDGPRFYQVLGEGNYKVLYYYRKKLDISTLSGKLTFSTVRVSYVLSDESLMLFKSNKSFVSLFHPGFKQDIKNYMHQNKINVKKASDQKMADLINFIGGLK